MLVMQYLHTVLSFRRRRNLRNTIRQSDFFYLDCGVTCGDFSFVEMTSLGIIWGLKTLMVEIYLEKALQEIFNLMTLSADYREAIQLLKYNLF
jgi:hypothetical protein